MNPDTVITLDVANIGEYKLAWKYAKFLSPVSQIMAAGDVSPTFFNEVFPLTFRYTPGFEPQIWMFEIFMRFIDHFESGDYTMRYYERFEMTPLEKELFDGMAMADLHQLSLFAVYSASREFGFAVGQKISEMIQDLSVDEIRAKWPEIFNK